MKVQFIEVEPYNNTGRGPEDGQKFFRRIPRNWYFEFDGTTKPKCMLMDVLVYKENMGLCTAKGILMSIDLDTYFEKLDIGKSHRDLLQSFGIGEIQIDYRSEDSPIQPQVSVRAKGF